MKQNQEDEDRSTVSKARRMLALLDLFGADALFDMDRDVRDNLMPLVREGQEVCDRAAANMLSAGWAVTSVLPDSESATPIEFQYSTGFTPTLGVPEVVILGMGGVVGAQIINVVGWRLRAMNHNERMRSMADGAIMRDIVANAGWEFGFRSLGTYAECGVLTVTAAVLGRDDFSVVQLLFPDAENHLPTSSRCNPRIVARQAWPPSGY